MDLTLHMEAYLDKYRFKYLALYHALREAIQDGRLPGGMKLPSTRELAELYGLSRGAVAQSYDMLMAEGYVHAETGRGSFVTHAGYSPRPQEKMKETPVKLSNWGERLLQLPRIPVDPAEQAEISFINQPLEMGRFPYEEWRSALSYAGGRKGSRLQHKAPPEGDSELREAIAAQLRVTRGIMARPEHIVLFSGSMQGIVLLFQLLMNEGETAVVEDPGFHGIRRAIKACGGIATPATVDRQGIVPKDWEAGILFVTPSRQYPTGAVLSLERRRELLDWAQRHDAVIIEDDYDSEFRFGGKPIEPLKALDTQERVIYIGSFSQTMFTGLRLGYAVLPEGLVAAAMRAKSLYEPMSPGLLEQRALARFMSKGGYMRHVRRLTRLYGARHRHFSEMMKEQMGDLFELMPGDAGLHVYAEWRKSPDEYRAFYEAAHRHGICFRDARVYWLNEGPPAACFGFAHLEEERITDGILRMRAAWQDVQNFS
ncbi:aminotransferase class I/II-fold pyridoxal phosphate-dependent enzyme [Paenibacillus sp. HJL G12]|uniref:Aminotransferase class I/II-fold pyridoxal phosphate-dependent enzyme n=1 Tax=Paenibacillus dendrobii TaxID=2691084 RepID=A0A7X3INJ1_9BACL|nr:PLP-dependent aminotransferase family protein [Paenibacillus dendrobii]MWV46870.1 aminotransferase class I/II-fold pyridoxal phosphate-dependent enzyme [Paenibacillus dendrobii]